MKPHRWPRALAPAQIGHPHQESKTECAGVIGSFYSGPFIQPRHDAEPLFVAVVKYILDLVVIRVVLHIPLPRCPVGRPASLLQESEPADLLSIDF